MGSTFLCVYLTIYFILHRLSPSNVMAKTASQQLHIYFLPDLWLEWRDFFSSRVLIGWLESHVHPWTIIVIKGICYSDWMDLDGPSSGARCRVSPTHTNYIVDNGKGLVPQREEMNHVEKKMSRKKPYVHYHVSELKDSSVYEILASKKKTHHKEDTASSRCSEWN